MDVVALLVKWLSLSILCVLQVTAFTASKYRDNYRAGRYPVYQGQRPYPYDIDYRPLPRHRKPVGYRPYDWRSNSDWERSYRPTRLRANRQYRKPAQVERVERPYTVGDQRVVPDRSQPQQPPSKVSVISGPLYNVAPHPKIQTPKKKTRARMRAVAKAKSFSGIIENTALDVNNLSS